MQALVPVLLMTIGPAQLFDEPVVDDEVFSLPVTAARPGWLLELSVGGEYPLADAAEWLDDIGQPAATLRGHYSLDRFVPGLQPHLGVSFWNRGSLGSGAVSLSMQVTEVELGASWQWPRDGLWNLAFPYVRAGLLLGWWRIRAGELGDDIWLKPGLRAALGVRVHFGRLVKHSSASSRLYAFGEASVAGRLTGRPQLSLLDDEDDTVLSGVPTRLGPLNLSGWAWSVGIGYAF